MGKPLALTHTLNITYNVHCTEHGVHMVLRAARIRRRFQALTQTLCIQGFMDRRTIEHGVHVVLCAARVEQRLERRALADGHGLVVANIGLARRVCPARASLSNPALMHVCPKKPNAHEKVCETQDTTVALNAACTVLCSCTAVLQENAPETHPQCPSFSTLKAGSRRGSHDSFTCTALTGVLQRLGAHSQRRSLRTPCGARSR